MIYNIFVILIYLGGWIVLINDPFEGLAFLKFCYYILMLGSTLFMLKMLKDD